MLDTTALINAVDRLADRLRATPQSALLKGAAAEGLALARELARRAQLLECPGRAPYEVPEGGIFSVGDQLAVAGHDLAEALASHGGSGAEGGAQARRTRQAEQMQQTQQAEQGLAEALALVEEGTRRCGGSAVGPVGGR
ncbi:hypothetical protein [Streptomyces daliensis]|uniref:Uncharacterized protein n=1 Tax=Streptomyces daliensis TaxID=299421 RepID=A0A8T4IJR3_9ACTN|nr:hypothetical protein [Streptomyces daliensis]